VSGSLSGKVGIVFIDKHGGRPKGPSGRGPIRDLEVLDGFAGIAFADWEEARMVVRPEEARGRSRRSVLSIVSFAWPGCKARLNWSSLLFLSCFFSEKAFSVDLSSSLLAGFTSTPVFQFGQLVGDGGSRTADSCPFFGVLWHKRYIKTMLPD
jgi:hypothetical protein